MSKPDLRTLLRMLDDPDRDTAVSVMAELLRYSGDLMPLLGEFQEDDDPLLRKRVQQLESIINLRNRRRQFAETLKKNSFNLPDALIELHLLWFDRDNSEMLKSMLCEFMLVAANNDIHNIRELGAFMARNGFAPAPEDERFEPENFCIGAILGDRRGADIMLCTLALLAGLDAGLPLVLVRTAGRFAVVSREGELIAPENDWRPERISSLTPGDCWSDPRAVLNYASLMMFLFAVSSDNFRYVHTLGHALCGTDEMAMLDFLPYPYNGKKNEQMQGESCENI